MAEEISSLVFCPLVDSPLTILSFLVNYTFGDTSLKDHYIHQWIALHWTFRRVYKALSAKTMSVIIELRRGKNSKITPLYLKSRRITFSSRYLSDIM